MAPPVFKTGLRDFRSKHEIVEGSHSYWTGREHRPMQL